MFTCKLFKPTIPIINKHIRRIYTCQFFKKLEPFTAGNKVLATDRLLCNKYLLRRFLQDLKTYEQSDRYLYDIFTEQLSAFATHSPALIARYFSGQLNLNAICMDFVRFCFSRDLRMDKDKTLASFRYHDSLSDKAVKDALQKLPSTRKTINILGYGCDTGLYEKQLAQSLLDTGKAGQVNLFGFDPYAKENKEIKLLTATQLRNNAHPEFQVVIARWVLHHVELQHRWRDFIQCINRSSQDALILIVEHGFLQYPDKLSPVDRRFYELFNAAFDVVANIGIRPQWFLSTYPEAGKNFFIHYLTSKDFVLMAEQATVKYIPTICELGPGMPNQTLYCLHR